jgi:hypothetical protein
MCASPTPLGDWHLNYALGKAGDCGPDGCVQRGRAKNQAQKTAAGAVTAAANQNSLYGFWTPALGSMPSDATIQHSATSRHEIDRLIARAIPRPHRHRLPSILSAVDSFIPSPAEATAATSLRGRSGRSLRHCNRSVGNFSRGGLCTISRPTLVDLHKKSGGAVDER